METVERNEIKCPNCGGTSRGEEKWWAFKLGAECNSNGGCGVVITLDNKVHFHQRPIPELTLCVELGEVLV